MESVRVSGDGVGGSGRVGLWDVLRLAVSVLSLELDFFTDFFSSSVSSTPSTSKAVNSSFLLSLSDSDISTSHIFLLDCGLGDIKGDILLRSMLK